MSNKSVSHRRLNGTILTVALATGLVAGSYLLQLQGSLHVWQLLVASILLFVFLLCLIFSLKQSPCIYLLVLAMALSAAYVRAWFHADSLIQNSLPPINKRISAEVEGCISSIPIHAANSVRFVVEVKNKSKVETSYKLHRIRVSVYKNAGATFYEELIAGSCWRMSLRLKSNRGLRNRGLFDYERWLFQRGIGATAYLQGVPERIAHDSFSLTKLRSILAVHINRVLDGHNSTGLILGLTLGDRNLLDADDWQVLQRTGTSHLLAISGLHIGIAALFGYISGRLLWICLLPGMKRQITPRMVGMLSGLVCALVYAGLAGFSVSTQRALIMLFSSYLAIWCTRSVSKVSIVCFALIIVIAYDPLSILSAGTWFSFIAVSVLIFLTCRDRCVGTRKPEGSGYFTRFKAAMRLQLLLMLALLMPTGMVFGEVSLLGPWVNLVLIPVFALTVVPVLLSAVLVLPIFPDLAAFALNLEADWLALIWSGLVMISRIDVATYNSGFDTVAMLMGLILLAPVFLPRGIMPRLLVIILLAPAGHEPETALSGSFLQLETYDVGHGLAVLVRTKEHSLLYDTGPAYSSGSSAAGNVILPSLKRSGIRQLSAVVISHTDNDHAGGWKHIQAKLPVARVFSPENDPVSTGEACSEGKSWTWDGVYFEFIYPFGKLMDADNNNLSCVLRISVMTAYGEQSVLLTGDIERRAERLIAQRYPQLAASIVFAPHHGSNTSSTRALTQQLAPDYVIYSTAFANQWGFPRKKVIQDWASTGPSVQQFNTAIDGNLTFELKHTGVWTVKTWMQTDCRYWHLDCK